MRNLGIVSTLCRMAWRNLWRNPRRSLVTMGTMTVALCALVVFSGLLQGMQAALERNVVELETGDVQIVAKGYGERPSIYLRIAEPEALLARLDRAGYAASARLRASGLAASGQSSAGALLIGLDVARDHRVSRVDREVAEGAWLDSSDASGVVVGKRLAQTLGLHPGSELVLLANAADGSMANQLYRVRGVLRSVGAAIDRGGVFMNTTAWRQLLVVPDGAHQIIVRRPTRGDLGGSDLATARATVARLAPGAEVRSWKQLLPTLANMLETQRSSMMLIALIVYAAVAVVLLNAMMMAVFERIRELGVLKAVGMKPASVFALVLIEGLWQAVLSVALGLAWAAPLLYYLAHRGLNLASLAGASVQGVAYDSHWYAVVDRTTFTGPLVMLLVAMALALVFPALKAARLSPIDAMHYR